MSYSKTCACCREELEAIHFRRRDQAHDGLHSYCKECDYELSIIWRNRRRGIDQGQMLKSQGSKCAICDAEIKLDYLSYSGVVDHNHKSGRVRGLLCWGCS
jgi:hypothetical protein